jgi:hypothetical protein
MNAIVVTDKAAGTAGMKLMSGPSRGGGARQPLGRELRRCHFPGLCIGIQPGKTNEQAS